jgi:DUF4097 and DUF4098 domain-containing protein YvlB
VSSPTRAIHRLEVGAQPRLEVDIVAGEVRVRVGPPGVVSLTIETNDASQIEVTQTGDTVSVHKPWGWSGRRRQVLVHAEVPEGADIVVSATSAEIRLDGSFGATKVHTVSGDITVGTIDRGEVDSTSGDVKLHTTGTLEASTISGDVTVGHVRGRLKASLTSGDLRADRVDGNAEVATMSGDVAIGRCDGDDIAIRSVSGDLRLALPGGIRVEPDIATVSGKAVLPSTPAAPTTGERRRVRLRLRTVSGDIRLERC